MVWHHVAWYGSGPFARITFTSVVTIVIPDSYFCFNVYTFAMIFPLSVVLQLNFSWVKITTTGVTSIRFMDP